MDDNNFIMIAGEEELRYELENGLVFIHRPLTAKEMINYKNSIGYRRRGKVMITKSAEQQIKLADKIMLNIEGLGYRDPSGKVRVLNKDTKAADISHLKVDGVAPKSWKELVPALSKFQFIEGLIAGLEETEKNE